MRPASKLSDCVDWDGLTYHVDPVQQRVAQMVCEHEQLVRQLERQLMAARTALSKYSAHCGQNVVDGREDLVCLRHSWLVTLLTCPKHFVRIC